MKNLFLVSQIKKSYENRGFLFEIKMNKETVSQNFTGIEKAKENILNNSRKERLPLSAKAQTHQELNKLSSKTESNLINKQENPAKKPTAKKETLDKKQPTLEELQKDPEKRKEVAQILEEEGKKFVTTDPQIKEIISRDYDNPEELSQNLKNYLESDETAHKFAKHLTLIPKDPGNMAKIAIASFALQAIGSEEGWRTSLGKWVKTSLFIGALSHPAVTGAIAHSLKFAGKWSYKILSYPVAGLVEFIYNPKQFIDKLKNGKSPIAKDKIAETLIRSQDPVVMRKAGMEFSPELDSVLDFMGNNLDFREISEIPPEIRKNAAKFLYQTDKVMQGVAEEKIRAIRTKIHNGDKVSDTDFRLVLVWKARQRIKILFGQKARFQNDLEFEKNKIREAQAKLPENAKNKLKELGLTDLSQVVATNQGNFARFYKERTKKHGIGRALDNMSATGLLAYIFMFFIMKGVMGASHLFKKGWENTKETREKLANSPFKTIAKGVWFPFKKVGQGLSYLLGKPFTWLKRKSILKAGKTRGWNENQVEAWNKLPKKEKNKVVKELKKIIENKRKLKNEEMEKIRKKYKKDKKWWQIFKRKIDKKELKDVPQYDNILKDIEEAKRTTLKNTNNLTDEEWKNAFKDVKNDKPKVYKVLFPSSN